MEKCLAFPKGRLVTLFLISEICDRTFRHKAANIHASLKIIKSVPHASRRTKGRVIEFCVSRAMNLSSFALFPY